MATKTKPFPSISAAQQYERNQRLKGQAGYAPFAPNLAPPSGYYDPALDAQLAATKRGLADTQSDYDTGISRLGSDYALGQQGVNQGADRNLADLTRTRDRSLSDYDVQRGQTTQDRDTAVASLQRAYARTANAQRQRMNASGVLSGGARLQAAAKRTANEALDRAPIDTGYARAIQGIDTGVSRLGENFATQSGRIGEDRQSQLAQLALQSGPQGRSAQDLLTGLTRAQRETAQFGLDTTTAAAQQAAQAGWNPNAGKPSNEFTSPAGTTYRVLKTATGNVFQLPDGRRVKTRPS